MMGVGRDEAKRCEGEEGKGEDGWESEEWVT